MEYSPYSFGEKRLLVIIFEKNKHPAPNTITNKEKCVFINLVEWFKLVFNLN